MPGPALRFAVALLAFTVTLVLVGSAHAFAASDSGSRYHGRDNQANDRGPANAYTALTGGTGWNCPPELVDDDAQVEVLSGIPNFKFRFHDGTGMVALTALTISTNGVVSFSTDGISYINSNIPNSADPSHLVAGYWDDLYPPSGGTICWKEITGGTSDRIVVVRYHEVVSIYSSDAFTFAVVLYEAYDTIEVHYAPVKGNSGYVYSATAGMETGRGAATTGIQYQTGSFLPDKQAIQYRPPGVYPTARPDIYVLDWKVAQTLSVPGSTGLVANDQKVGYAPLSAEALTAPAGLLTPLGGGPAGKVSPDGGFAFTPPSGDPCDYGSGEEPYTFTYHADDGWPNDPVNPPRDVAGVTIRVVNCNDPPVAAADSFDMMEDVSIEVAAPGVLANDSDDAWVKPMTASLVQPPANAKTFTLKADGSFSYQGAKDFSGLDSFTYRAYDGRDHGNIVKVTLDVANVNDPPVADESGADGLEDEDPGIVLQLGGTDVDGDAIQGCIVREAPAEGTLTRLEECRYLYTPPTDFVGTKTLSYQVTDGLATSAVVDFPIRLTPFNDRPDAQDVLAHGVEETTLQITGSTSDKEGDATTRCEVAGAEVGGVATLTTSPCTFTFVPTPDFQGDASFLYRAFDVHHEGTPGRLGRATLRLSDTPDAPMLLHLEATLPEDTVLGPLALVYDPDAVQPTCDVVGAPRLGRVTGTHCGEMRYIPDASRAGRDRFTYRVVDAVFGELAETGLARLEILPVNDAPVATPLLVVADQDAVTTFRLGGRDVETEASALTCSLASQPSRGTAALDPADTCHATYVPLEGFVGFDTFAFRTSDGELESEPAAVVLQVGGGNARPRGGDLALTTLEDVAVPVAFPASDFDSEVTCRILWGPGRGELTGPPGDCQRTYVPGPDLHGNDTIRFAVADEVGLSREHWVNITVLPVPDFPVAEADTYRLQPGRANAIDAGHGVLGNDHHPDGLDVGVQVVEPPRHGALVLARDGSFVYHAGSPGRDQFVYRATDTAGRSRDGVVDIEVRDNEPPVADFVAAPQAAAVGQPVRFLDRSHDPEGGPLAYRWDLGDGTVIDAAAAERAYAKPGVYTVSLQVTDEAGAVAAQTQRVTVGEAAPGDEPPGEPPVADAGPDQQARAGETVVLGASASRGVARSFLWTQVGGPLLALDGFGAQNLSFVAPAPVGAGLEAVEFELVVFDGHQASAPDRVAVVLLPALSAPEPKLKVDGPDKAAPGERVRLVPLAEGFRNPVAFGWRQLGGPSVALRTDLDGTLTVTAPDRPAELVFEATAQDGLAVVRQLATVVVAPDAPVAFDVQRGGSRGIWTFMATAPGQHVWDFGDGSLGYGTSVTHRFREDGRYLVTLDPEGDAPLHAASVTVAGRADAASGGPGWAAVSAGLVLVGVAGAAAWRIGRRG